MTRAPQRGRRNRGLDANYLAHALFHHGAALDCIGELVADQHAVFIVFVGRSRVDVAGHARNGTRRNTALVDLVALVSSVGPRPGGHPVRPGDQLATVDYGIEVKVPRVDAEPAFRQQQIAKHHTGALEAVDDVEYFRDEPEAIPNVERSSNDPGIIAEGSAEHLPKVALLGLGGNSRGRAGPLAVDDHHWGFDHGRHAEAFAHQGKTAARGGTHSANAGVRSSNGHIDYPDLIFHLPNHDAGLARVRRHPVQNAGRRAHWISAVEFYAGCCPAHGHRDVAAEHRVTVLSHGKRAGKRLEVQGGVFIARTRETDVFGHHGLAFLLELFGQDAL